MKSLLIRVSNTLHRDVQDKFVSYIILVGLIYFIGVVAMFETRSMICVRSVVMDLLLPQLGAAGS